MEQDLTRLRLQIRAVVNASDPMGFLRSGAPSDEYDTEVEDILAAYLRIGPQEESLAEEIQNTFDRWFTPASVPLARSRFIATKLCELLPTDEVT